MRDPGTTSPKYGALREGLTPDAPRAGRSALTAAALEEIRALPGQFPEPRSAVMPALDLVQEEFGYIPPEGIRDVAHALNLDPGYVEGVATFYSLFHLQPVGRHRFYICTNIACLLRGADDLVDYLRRRLGLRDPGDVTPGGLFSVEEVECLGCCEYAPAARVDHRFEYDLTVEKLDRLVMERGGQSVQLGRRQGIHQRLRPPH